MFTGRIIVLACSAAALFALPAKGQEVRLAQATVPQAQTAGKATNVQFVSRDVKIIPMSDDAKVASATMVFVPNDASELGGADSPASSQLAERLRRSNHRSTESPWAEPKSAMKKASATKRSADDYSGDAQAGSSCDVGGCDLGCSSCGKVDCCCAPEFWEHRSGLSAELLYLHASGVDMAHAIRQNGTGGPGTTPNGRVGVVDQQYEPGFRFSFEKARSPCTSIVASYARVDSHSTDSLTQADGVGSTVASLVMHPETVNAGSTSTLVDALYDIDFQTIDVEISQLLAGGCNHAVNYSIGVRYGNLEQQFSQIGLFAPPVGVIQTSTDIDFNGGGLRLGIDGHRKVGCRGFSFYGKSFINVLFGEFSSSYTQINRTTTVIEAYSTWNDDRVVPVLEYELGVNWTNCSGRLRVSTGYYTAFWFNAITTPEYVQAVQNANFVNLGDTIAFDGLTARVEYRF